MKYLSLGRRLWLWGTRSPIFGKSLWKSTCNCRRPIGSDVAYFLRQRSWGIRWLTAAGSWSMVRKSGGGCWGLWKKWVWLRTVAGGSNVFACKGWWNCVWLKVWGIARGLLMLWIAMKWVWCGDVPYSRWRNGRGCGMLRKSALAVRRSGRGVSSVCVRDVVHGWRIHGFTLRVLLNGQKVQYWVQIVTLLSRGWCQSLFDYGPRGASRFYTRRTLLRLPFLVTVGYTIWATFIV